jgi:hypothetical protein
MHCTISAIIKINVLYNKGIRKSLNKQVGLEVKVHRCHGGFCVHPLSIMQGIPIAKTSIDTATSIVSHVIHEYDVIDNPDSPSHSDPILIPSEKTREPTVKMSDDSQSPSQGNSQSLLPQAQQQQRVSVSPTPPSADVEVEPGTNLLYMYSTQLEVEQPNGSWDNVTESDIHKIVDKDKDEVNKKEDKDNSTMSRTAAKAIVPEEVQEPLYELPYPRVNCPEKIVSVIVHPVTDTTSAIQYVLGVPCT